MGLLVWIVTSAVLLHSPPQAIGDEIFLLDGGDEDSDIESPMSRRSKMCLHSSSTILAYARKVPCSFCVTSVVAAVPSRATRASESNLAWPRLDTNLLFLKGCMRPSACPAKLGDLFPPAFFAIYVVSRITCNLCNIYN